MLWFSGTFVSIWKSLIITEILIAVLYVLMMPINFIDTESDYRLTSILFLLFLTLIQIGFAFYYIRKSWPIWMNGLHHGFSKLLLYVWGTHGVFQIVAQFMMLNFGYDSVIGMVSFCFISCLVINMVYGWYSLFMRDDFKDYINLNDQQAQNIAWQ